MTGTFLDNLFGNKQRQDLKILLPIVSAINQKESWALKIPTEDFPHYTEEWTQKLAENPGESDRLIPEVFSLAREAARRTLKERMYDVQLMGALVLHQGAIAEMKTGEGKTLACVPAAYLNVLMGKNIHIVTVNDYLAQRDAKWMGKVFDNLGISVGVIQAQMDNTARRQAYKQNIIYATNNELGFDYLRDHMCYRLEQKVQCGHTFCIVDEVDSILIDEARTPLIISGSMETGTKNYYEANRIVGQLKECKKDPQTGEYPEEPEGDYKLDEKSKRVSFTNEGMQEMERLLQSNRSITGSLFADENFEYLHHVTQSVRAHQLYHLDKQYVINEKKVEIVDEFTGRVLHGRRYSDGLHQAIEVKEKMAVREQTRTVATITLQNYFRMYDKISGMTGTASTEAVEFGKIYNMDVVEIPTNQPMVRNDEQDLIFATEQDKYEAICKEIQRIHETGQPILVGTVSVERSEYLAVLLKRAGIRHQILNAKNHEREAYIIAEAGTENVITIATNMAGRGTDIKLGGNPEFRARTKLTEEDNPDEFVQQLEKEQSHWKKQYENIRSKGGLFVLGTERHESRRIDNQLRGRSGRQGDPGRSQFFISMDDDLMRLFGKSRQSIQGLMKRGGTEQEPLNHPLITRSIGRAQKRVEERNFTIRKHLLEFDDVLNTQRNIIYQQRDSILTDSDLMQRVFTTLENLATTLLHPYKRSGDLIDWHTSITALKETLLSQVDLDDPTKNSDETTSKVIESLKEELREKEESVGKQKWNFFIRIEYLKNIDRQWQNHLATLEGLREAVYLRSYAQKNPLLEYKLEGFQTFDQMIERIRTSIVRTLFAVKITQNTDQYASKLPQDFRSQHKSVGQFAGTRTPPPTATAAGGTATIVRRSVPKVGRNDPCPCGSGKKYKRCHGA